MDKLIRKLREWTFWCGSTHKYSHDIHPHICDDAANALEELQAQLKQVKTELTVYKQTGWEPCDYKLLGTYKDEADKARKELNEAVCEIAALRAQEAEKNEPLTLAELRQMDGEPVYVISDWPDENGWRIIDCVMNHGREVDVFFNDDVRENGTELNETWLAYRRKPKEADHETD